MREHIKTALKVGAQILFPILSIPTHFDRIDLSDVAIKEAKLKLEEYSPDSKASCFRDETIAIQNKGEWNLDIIIPVYNVERFLTECLDSVFNQQTEYRYRVILIDDGSTDRSSIIVDEYKKRFPQNLLVIRQKNGGISSARNAGLNILDSHYVMFIDSDDYLIGNNVIQILLSTAYKENADIVQAGYKRCTETGLLSTSVESAYDGCISIDSLYGQPWGKVIKAALFYRTVFPVGYWYEDSIMKQVIYPQAEVIYSVSMALYAYRLNSNGATISGSNNKKSIDSLWITMQLYKDRMELQIPDSLGYYEYLLRMAKLNAYRVSKQPEDIQKSVFIVYADFIKKTKCFGKSVSNKHMEYALRNGCYKMYKLIANLRI